jgi:hypothetical protein
MITPTHQDALPLQQRFCRHVQRSSACQLQQCRQQQPLIVAVLQPHVQLKQGLVV